MLDVILANIIGHQDIRMVPASEDHRAERFFDRVPRGTNHPSILIIPHARIAMRPICKSLIVGKHLGRGVGLPLGERDP